MKMKGYKLVFFALLFILYNVKAYSNNLVLECNTTSIDSGDKLTCDLILEYNSNNISSIEFSLWTNFKVSYVPVDKFVLNNDNGKISLISSENLNNENNQNRILSIILEESELTNTGENDITINDIVIKEEDNNYVIPSILKTININEKKNLCSISNIIIDGKIIDDFDVNKYRYDNIYVSKMAVFIDAIKCDPKVNITGLGYVVVPKDTTIERIVRVTSNEKTEEYTLVISNKEENSKPDIIDDDNNLASLELINNNKKIDFNFDSSKTIYNVIVNSNIDKLTIKGVLNSDTASFVSGYEPKSILLNDGDNLVEIKVKSFNNIVKTYTINIFKEKKLSDDNNLQSLMINECNIELLDDILDYEIELPNIITRTNVVAVSNDNNAKIDYQDIDLIEGENSLIIKVISESNKVREYKINVIRQMLDKITFDISVDKYNLNFDINKHEYDLNILENKLNILVEPDDLEYEIIGNDDLIDGSKIVIKVKLPDGIENYTINIHKDKAFNLIYYAIFIFGVVSLIISIIYVKVLNVSTF